MAFSQGNCNESDLDYLGENLDAVILTAQDCALGCFFNPDTEGCITNCILAETPLTTECASCFGEQVQCLIDNCLGQCPPLGTEEGCEDCLAEFCLDDFNTCAGIVDSDNDGFDTLTDCDDTNGDIYPGAPGTGEDIDNNCDGLVEGDELAGPCEGDFNLDGAVNVTDLGIMLSDYGCLEDCVSDLTGDGVTTISDISPFLSAFGSSCD